MQVTVEKNQIVITLDKNPKPIISSTGKTLQVATSHGNIPTNIEVDGLIMSVGVNCFTRNPDYVKPPK